MQANILQTIIAHKRGEIERRSHETPEAALREHALATAPPPPMIDALRASPMGLIAEVKHRSPSAGIIRDPFDPAEIAAGYERAGAQALSVLVDQEFFGGGEDRVVAAHRASGLPILYKEFVVAPWQVWHARSIGASAVLLIIGVLDEPECARLMEVARHAGLETLVEVHDAEQMRMAVAVGASLVGINNRDLTSFTVSLDTTYALMDGAPAGCTLVSESGIRTAEDVERLREAGVHAVLVGEHLLRQPDPEAAVRELMGIAWASS